MCLRVFWAKPPKQTLKKKDQKKTTITNKTTRTTLNESAEELIIGTSTSAAPCSSDSMASTDSVVHCGATKCRIAVHCPEFSIATDHLTACCTSGFECTPVHQHTSMPKKTTNKRQTKEQTKQASVRSGTKERALRERTGGHCAAWLLCNMVATVAPLYRWLPVPSVRTPPSYSVLR